MSTGVLDMALDDVIQQHKGERRGGFRSRGGRGGNRRNNVELGQYNDQGTGGAFRRERFNSRNRAPYGSRRGGNSMDVDREAVLGDETSVWKHDMFEQTQNDEGQRFNNRPRRNEGRVASLETGTKVLVTNLDYGVSEDDLKELFEQCGEIKRVRIRYDKAGRSQGNGEVVFAKRSDASDAVRKYNTVELDGKPMNVSLAPAPVQRSRSENDGLFVSTGGSGRRIVGNNNNNNGGRRSFIRGGGGRGGRRPSFRNRNNTMSDN